MTHNTKMPGAAVRVQGLRRVYGDRAVLDGLDLDIAPGEIIALLGPSGCGKTTTLRMVAGLEDVSDGKLSIGGKVVNDVAPKERGVAMVFQNYALYPHMSVYENMAFGLKQAKTPKDEIERRVMPARYIVGDGEGQVMTVLAGCGIAQLPTWLIKQHLADGSLVQVLPHLASEGLAINLVWPKSRKALRKVSALLDALTAGLMPLAN